MRGFTFTCETLAYFSECIVHINCYIFSILMDNLSLYMILKNREIVQGNLSKQCKYGHSKF